MTDTMDKQEGRQRRSLRPLARILPYLVAYRGMLAGALFFLALAAAAMLSLPLAVRRMIDVGFSDADTDFVANYFAMLLVIAVVLALASACRYYFVVTLGERVVSDLRSDVFSHVTRLSPAFFDAIQSGEIVSRLTADTTQIKSAVGATASQALRNIILGMAQNHDVRRSITIDWMEKEDEDGNDGDKKMMSDEDVKSLLSGHYEVVIPYPFSRKTDGRYIRCSKCGAEGTSNLYLCQKFKRPYVNWLYCKNCWCCVPFCMPEDISMKGLLIGDD
jgi:hypothetical protein